MNPARYSALHWGQNMVTSLVACFAMTILPRSPPIFRDRASDPQSSGIAVKPFTSESEPLKKAARSVIVRLNVGFQPMQPEATKRERDHSPKSLCHVPTSAVRRESIVAQIARPENTTNDLANIDDTGQLLRIGEYPIRNIFRLLEVFR